MKKISLVAFTYNRSGYLYETLKHFYDNCLLEAAEIELIISDDGSNNEHALAVIQIAKHFGTDKVLFNEHKGLGHNQNRGLLEATSPYIFHLQDDFALINEAKDKALIKTGIEILEKHQDIDLVNYRYDVKGIASYKGRVGELGTINGLTIKTMEGKGWTYSDGPHLKRLGFHTKYGYFDEKGSGSRECELTEFEFSQKCNGMGLRTAHIGQWFHHFGGKSVIRHIWTKDHHYLDGKRPPTLYEENI